MWTQIQKERAQRQRREQQAVRAQTKAQEQARRDLERARREAAKQAAATARERQRLHVEQRQAEAEQLTKDCELRVDELSTLLRSGPRRGGAPLFGDLKKEFHEPAFDARGLNTPIPEPDWAELAPSPPGLLGRFLGGATLYEDRLAGAREEYEKLRARHSQDERERRRALEELRCEHARCVQESHDAVRQHNEAVDQFQEDFGRLDPEAVARYFTLVLDHMAWPEGFPRDFRLAFRPEARELVIDYELPTQAVIPDTRSYRYVVKRDVVEPRPRPVTEIKKLYAGLLAQTALRTLQHVFAARDPEVVHQVSFNGFVRSKDPATGQPDRPYLIGVNADRSTFDELVLTELDPVVCVKQRLGARVSPHPYDHEAVRPMVDFEELLKQFSFIEGMDAAADLDDRMDLLSLNPYDFEHLVRQLFEAMGMRSWVTKAAKDDGVDAVATNEDPIFGGLCVVQAKRYSKAVGVDAVRELAGTMEDKHATKGIMVTTSWVTSGGHDHARRHGRIQIIEHDNLRYLLREHLGLDVLIGLPKKPPRRT